MQTFWKENALLALLHFSNEILVRLGELLVTLFEPFTFYHIFCRPTPSIGLLTAIFPVTYHELIFYFELPKNESQNKLFSEKAHKLLTTQH